MLPGEKWVPVTEPCRGENGEPCYNVGPGFSKRATLEYLTGLTCRDVGDGWYEARYADRTGYWHGILFREFTTRPAAERRGRDEESDDNFMLSRRWDAAAGCWEEVWNQDTHWRNALSNFVSGRADLIDVPVGDVVCTLYVGNWHDARSGMNVAYQTAAGVEDHLTFVAVRGDPVTLPWGQIQDRRAIALVGATRMLALAYLYENLPEGILLDHLKEQGLLTETGGVKPGTQRPWER